MINAQDVAALFDDVGDMMEAIKAKDIEGWTLADAEEIKNAMESSGFAVEDLWAKLLTDEEYAEIEREGRDLDH